MKYLKTKIAIDVYDPRITKPPYGFIKLEEFETELPPSILDPDGKLKSSILNTECRSRGYSMRFHTIDSKTGGYRVTVHNKNSPGTGSWYGKDYLKGKELPAI